MYNRLFYYNCCRLGLSDDMRSDR